VLSLFKTRNKLYSHVNRVSDYLGKSIRENTTILSFDDVNKSVSILTESNHVIEADVNVNEERISLNKIKVFTVDEYYSDEKFENQINNNAVNLLSHISEKEFSKAENEFHKLIEQFDRKAQAAGSKNILERKVRSVANRNILHTEVWKKLNESKKNLIKYIKENKEAILNNEDLINTIALSRAISSAIQVPHITLESLSKRKRFSIPINYQDSIYDLICKKELIQKELLEAKKEFSSMYGSSQAMHKLSLGFNTNDEALVHLISEAIQEIPMFALTTKSQLAESIARVHSIFESAVSISDAKFSEFISRIYEAKKPFKAEILRHLNEEYGINTASLTYKPSFTDLAKANSASLEILSKVSKDEFPSLSEALNEASQEIRNKAGFSALFISDFLNEAFTKGSILNELDMGAGTPSGSSLDLDAIKAELLKIKDALLGVDSGNEDEMVDEEPEMDANPEAEPEMDEQSPSLGGEGDDDIHIDIDSHNGEEEMSPEEEYNEGEAEPEPDGDELAAMGQEEEAPPMPQEEEEEEMPPMPGPDDSFSPNGGDVASNPLAGEEEETKSEIMDILNDLEAIVSPGPKKPEPKKPGINPNQINDEEI
jgi:hypothetical protein